MWIVAFVTMGINYIITIINISQVAYSINIAIFFLFGWFASDLREYYARKNGLELSDIILAQNEEEAEAKYYMRTST